MSPPHRAFTLLEVVLALAISIVLLAALNMAIGLHLGAVNDGRGEVEEAQLARALLHRMADDLRSAVTHQELDVEPVLPAATEGSEAGGGGGPDDAGGDEPSPGSGGGDSESGAEGSGQDDITTGSNEEAEKESADSSISESTTIPELPGLYGTQYALQVDVGRLPRVEEYDPLLIAEAAGTPPGLASDVKTVAYYIGDGFGMGREPSLGLVRRELDRSATQFATIQGMVSDLDQFARLLAPEVLAVEFRYFDGTQWLVEWDSATQEALPLAVEIALVVVVGDELTTAIADYRGLESSDPLTAGAEDFRVYRLVVDLPNAIPAADATSTSTESEEETSGQDTAAEETP